MLAIEVEYLMGRVLASTRDDRKAVEWPPHPTRLFSALVAAYGECGLGNEVRVALEWLEGLPEPQIHAQSPAHGGWVRDALDIFVPVNDSNDQLKIGKEGKVSLFPFIAEGIGVRRGRDKRWFPVFTPEDPCIWFIWPNASDDKRYVHYLQQVAENVTYLGHSMSPVRVRVSNSAPYPTLIPDRMGTIMLRTMGKGRLQHLEEIHRLRIENATIQPRLGRVTRYRTVQEETAEPPTSLFRHQFFFRRKEGAHLPFEGMAKLSLAVRKAVMNLYPDPVPEVISGHAPDGRRSNNPHLSVTPLPDAGHGHADGHLLGFGLWLPRDITAENLETLEDALVQFTSLTLGKHGVWEIEPVAAEIETRAAAGLRCTTYTKAHDIWASVTPVLFGHAPKRSKVGVGKDGGKVFAELCGMIGLPKPVEARLGPVSTFRGIPIARECVSPAKFANYFKAHVWLRFGRPVQGPVLIGAGRYLGFGLCRPLFGQREA